MKMHSALRCNSCLISWPNARHLYEHCPICGEKTSYLVASSAPLGDDEAIELAVHGRFERWLKDESETDRALREAEYDELENTSNQSEFDAIVAGIEDEEWFRMHFEFLEEQLAALD